MRAAVRQRVPRADVARDAGPAHYQSSLKEEMATPTQPELERLRYWQGQKLGNKDFRAQALIEAQLRSWHNRALHNAFGISLGLKVTRVPDTDVFTAVSVARGVAYDCYGRELLLQTARDIPLPSTGSQPPSRMTLLFAYKETLEY